MTTGAINVINIAKYAYDSALPTFQKTPLCPSLPLHNHIEIFYLHRQRIMYAECVCRASVFIQLLCPCVRVSEWS